MIANALLKALPEAISSRMRLVWHSMRVPLPAIHHFSCPMCRYHGVFLPFGLPIRPSAKCPQCGSLERHRHFFLWFARNADAVANKRIVHFAPEPAIRKLLQPPASHYISGDLAPGAGDRVLDIEALDLPDGSADMVFCSHVLEHVHDGKALHEIHRVLSPGGLAIILVPIIEGWKETYENEAIATPEERDLHFGQDDHIRYFGADIRDRIKRAGFELSEFPAVEPDVHTYSLLRGDTIFLARK